MVKDDMAQAASEATATLKREIGSRETLFRVAAAFLSQDDRPFDETMADCARLVADTADIDIFSLWRNVGGPGDTAASQVYLWDRRMGGAAPVADAPECIPHYELGLLPGGHSGEDCKAGIVPGVAVMKKYGIKSALAAPIFISNAPWGFLLFADCRSVRCFDRVTVEMMRSAGLVFANNLIRSEMARELAETDELRRAAFDSSPIGQITLDGELKIIDCNNTALKIFGVTKETFKNDFFSLSPKVQQDGSNSKTKATEAMLRALHGEKVVLEWMHCTPSGDPIPCEITLAPLRYKNKNSVLAYIYDLRNLKRMEEAVTIAEGNIQTITDASPISFILFDSEMRPIDCNDTTLAIFGCYDKQSFLDDYFVKVISEKWVSHHRLLLKIQMKLT